MEDFLLKVQLKYLPAIPAAEVCADQDGLYSLQGQQNIDYIWLSDH